jgi:competence protein ComFC
MADRPTSGYHVGGWLVHAADALTSVLFPADCRICERLLLSSRRVPICEGCLQSFVRIQGPLCATCGLPASTWSLTPLGQPGNRQPVDILCSNCQTGSWGFDRARSFAEYKAALIRAIVLLKFEQLEPLGRWFADRLRVIALQERMEADVAVPVPLHRQRERERGYNQADLIARPLAKQLDLPYRAVLLVRTRPRPNKQILSLEERWESVRGAFATRPGSQVDNLRVLLVDDVMTTGATLDACAKALRAAGAKSVIGLTVARAARHPAVGSVKSNQRGAR